MSIAPDRPTTTTPSPVAFRKTGGLNFDAFSRTVADATGSPRAALAAAVVVIVWAMTGPVFGFGSGWQLVINTGTTIVTFLMVFLIQASQNRNDLALHAKLDALIAALPAASDDLKGIEDATATEIADARARL